MTAGLNLVADVLQIRGRAWRGLLDVAQLREVRLMQLLCLFREVHRLDREI